MFSKAVTQRSEHDNGPGCPGSMWSRPMRWRCQAGYYDLPPLICYLDRGPGASIRRARTRLPGGRQNPVAIIRVPRERMVGSGIGGSLIHEVGHQAAALLDLVPSLRPGAARPAARRRARARAVGNLGAMDLRNRRRLLVGGARRRRRDTRPMGVVSLPRPFVFRIDLDDPHPTPWLRVKLSTAMGQALYPHPQWNHFAALWEELYPPAGLDAAQWLCCGGWKRICPAFVTLLVNHRLLRLGGQSLPEVMQTGRALRSGWRRTFTIGPPIRRRCIARHRRSYRRHSARRARTNG